eukprot:TRINITY_DN685_c0_g1_i1.p1 TRINITY_DN685_c0_g1~~TRINITY_DN685_c0_g1_i1.p1  ORF type:complete len:181 (+),score=2.35 TRINITY_DN685_c0_g1_i1:128-670(+)
MGITVSRIFSRLFGKKELRILMVGLDAAGKPQFCTNSSLAKSKQRSQPSVSMSRPWNTRISNLTCGTSEANDRIRPLWRHYFSNTNAVIFVIDSSDRERINEARDELMRMLADDELRDAVLLVYANKQDLPRAMNATDITERLGLPTLRQRSRFIQSCCALTGDGLYEGLDWLSANLAQK